MKQSICLNMIVKNEAKVIRRCLDSVRPFIDCWVIVDTGSADGTQAIIREHLKGVPGQLHERPWKDFGNNRTEAIALAKGQGDYLFFMDASDVLQLPGDYRRPALTADAYNINISYGNLHYKRKALVSHRLPWRYVGVLHEYIDCPEKHSVADLDGPVILPNFGEAALTPEQSIAKYQSHAAILAKALETEPNNVRYVFYLAQSYRDSGQPLQALETYVKRAAMGGWDEEVFYSKLQAAKISENLALDPDVVLRRYLDAFEFRPSRAEPLVELARRFRLQNRFELARMFAERACRIPLPPDILFVDREAYDWRALDELAVASYWTGDYQTTDEVCRKLLSGAALPAGQRDRVVANLNFATEKLSGAKTVTADVKPLAVAATSSESLESILGRSGTIQVADIGAAFIAEVPLYKPLLDRDLGFLNAFDADKRHHDDIRKAFGGKVKVFSDIVGDGKRARLHLASPASGMSSLLEPDPENLAFFNGFKSFGEIFSREDVDTTKLDDVKGLPGLDFLKMDIQGSELPALQGGARVLSGCLAIQLEVSFVPLYKDQPCLGEIDLWMRQNGFVPHTMTDLKRWSVSPLIRDGNFRVPFNQLLEGDIVYFRDAISTESLSGEQIKKLALIAHYSYGSPDIVVHLIRKLIGRKVIAPGSDGRYLEMLKGPAFAQLGFFQ